MKTLQLNNIETDYHNRGQALEQIFRYNVTGEKVKADNVRAEDGTDCLHYSIKSARATVCRGTDLTAYLDTDKATEWVYITKDLTAYIMNRTEWVAFIETFGTVTVESQKNGGHKKIRLGHETSKMIEWLASRA